MEETFSIVDWIEAHPVIVGMIFTFIGGVTLILWNRYQDRIVIKVKIKPRAFTAGIVEGERGLVKIQFLITITNTSKVPVSVKDCYLKLPEDLRKVKELTGRFPPGVDFKNGARLYPNNFELMQEDGGRVLVPIKLDSPVMYFSIELTNASLLKQLHKKKIAFVAIDQNGKEHFSNPYKLSANSIIPDAMSRDI